jgi:hypothetical protein
MLWTLFLRFLLRLILGISVSMSLTSPREVRSGFFRVHLWVLLGLGTLAALIPLAPDTALPHRVLLFGLAAGIAIASYVGSVLWLYDRQHGGRLVLLGVAAIALVANALLADWPRAAGAFTVAIVLGDILTSSLLLGATISAMFLGHWYLSTPGMRLEPLKRLLLLLLVAVFARAGVCSLGLIMAASQGAWPAQLPVGTIGVRWVVGLAGTLVLTMMAHRTVQIPNTQSATGILYVAVIFVFLGELTSQLLSGQSLYLV